MGNEKTLRIVLGDQLTRGIPALSDLRPETDTVLMMEVGEEATHVRHHKQKIVLVLSAMRHFAEALREEGIPVDYVRLDTKENTGSFTGEVARAIARHGACRIVVTEPGEWRVRQVMTGWEKAFGIPVEIREDDRFLCSHSAFVAWAGDRKTYRMADFYRFMRKKTGWLMEKGKPAGGKWSFDAQNRKPLPRQMAVPARRRFSPDRITKDVIGLVSKRFGSHFGDLDGFGWAVTRNEALLALEDFIFKALPHFGDYQDAMKVGEDFVFHSALSPYLNIGLLTAREVCEAVLEAFENGVAPLGAVEGFIRQVLGWREFVRGVYWREMPGYAEGNFFNARRPLPECYWTGETPMRCLHQTIEATRRNAYAHHIQRLMITGNFALLAGIAPEAVEAWYLMVYADAFEWVELPNTHGMALFADGGLLSSKPYAASGAYIHRMSDYCAGCAYSPSVKLGPGACPFNYLYWDFLMRNHHLLKTSPRMAIPYRTLERMGEQKRAEIRRQADDFLSCG